MRCRPDQDCVENEKGRSIFIPSASSFPAIITVGVFLFFPFLLSKIQPHRWPHTSTPFFNPSHIFSQWFRWFTPERPSSVIRPVIGPRTSLRRAAAAETRRGLASDGRRVTFGWHGEGLLLCDSEKVSFSVTVSGGRGPETCADNFILMNYRLHACGWITHTVWTFTAFSSNIPHQSVLFVCSFVFVDCATTHLGTYYTATISNRWDA